MMSTFNSMPALSSGPDGLGLTHNGHALGIDFDQELHFDDSLL